MQVVCENCGKKFKLKSDLKRHKNRKKPCNLFETLQKENNELKEKLEILSKETSKLKDKKEIKRKIDDDNNIEKNVVNVITNNQITNNQIINNQTNNIQINQNLNIILNSIENSDYSSMTPEILDKILSRTLFSIPEFLKIFHFNPKIPENHNIYVSDFTRKKFIIYQQNTWIERYGIDNCKKIINFIESTLCDRVNDVPKEHILKNKINKKYQLYVDVKDKPNSIDNLSKEILKCLFENREIVKKSKKLLNN